MALLENLRVLSLRADDMVQETCSSFEEHFLWLEEVLAEARRTLASEDLVLLPKTPSAAPKKSRRVIKDTDSQTSTENAENSPPSSEVGSPPTRRGRLCSKLANQKIQELTRLSRVKKLRRPSSPVTQVPPTTSRRNKFRQVSLSPSPSRSDEKSSESTAPKSVQATPPSTKRAHRSVRLVLDPVDTNTPPPSVTTSRKELASPLKDEGSAEKESSQQNKSSPLLKKDKNTTQMDDASSQDHTSSKKSLGSSPQKMSLPADEVACSSKNNSSVREVNCSPKEASSQEKEIPYQTPMEVSSQEKEISRHSPKEVSSKEISSDVLSNHNETQKRNVEQGDKVDHSQNSMKGKVDSQTLHQEDEDFHLHLDDSYSDILPLDDEEANEGKEKEEKVEDMEVVWESSEVKDKPEQVTSQNSPSQVTLNAQPKPGSPSQECSTQHSSAPAQKVTTTSQKPAVPPPFAPAPRVTRTKQRAVDAQDVPPPSDSEPHPPSAPAPRVRRTKQKTAKMQEVEDMLSTGSTPHTPSSPAPAPRVTRTKQKAVAVPDPPAFSDGTASPTSPRVPHPKQEVKVQNAPVLPETLGQPPSAPAPRMTRTKQRAIEAQETLASVPQPATRVTRTKQKAREDQQALSMNVNKEDEEGEQVSEDRGLKASSVKDSGVFSLGIRKEGWSSAESLSSGGSCAPRQHTSSPPRRITRSKVSRLQQDQQSPKALPSIPNFQRVCCSPRGTGLPCSPQKDSPASRKLAPHPSRDGVQQLASEISHSPVRVVRHSPDKAGKVVEPRLQMQAGRITPSIVSRMQPFLTASSSSASSSSAGHARIIKRTMGTPSENRRPANIVSGITSFIKSQPVRPNRDEQRLQELQKKKEREEDTLKKKEQLLKAKTEERKRRNEERMRRVQETIQEQERQAGLAKEKLERERRQRDERQREERQREEEERERRRQLVKKKAEEEAKKAAKLKEMQEERKRLEEEKKQKLEEEKRKQRIEEEEYAIKYQAQKKKMEEQMKLKMTVSQMMKKKYEVEQPKPKEALPVSKQNEQQAPKQNEQQASKQQEAKTVMSTYKETGALNTTYTSSTKTKENSDGLNSTYTKPAADAKVDSYEMTPHQPKRVSSSLNNYDINDIQSDDSTDDDASPKKKIPQWAMKTQLQAAVLQQEHYPPALDGIFPPNTLLILPDLTRIFPKQKRRFRKRTSSAQWGTPPAKVFRTIAYT